jgi:hypothetical protein
MPGTKDEFIDMKWVKKVEDFQSCWIFIDIFEDSELFLVTGDPPAKRTTWASEALPEAALNALPLDPGAVPCRHHSPDSGGRVRYFYILKPLALIMFMDAAVWRDLDVSLSEQDTYAMLRMLMEAAVEWVLNVSLSEQQTCVIYFFLIMFIVAVVWWVLDVSLFEQQNPVLYMLIMFMDAAV